MSPARTRATVLAATVLLMTAAGCSDSPRRQSLQVTPSSAPTGGSTTAPPTASALPAGWQRIPTAPAPEGSIALWTGRELVVGKGCCTDNSAETLHGYDPATQTWHAYPPAPLSPRLSAIAGWTGHEVVVVGGTTPGTDPSSGGLTDGAALDPSTGTWRAIAPLPAPVSWGSGPPRAIWIGRELVVADQYGNSLNPVGSEVLLAYDPTADHWRRLPPSGLSPRTRSTLAWTGSRLIVWGGQGTPDANGNVAFTDGAMLDPSSGRWTTIPDAPVKPQYVTSATWAGSRFIVVGASTNPAVTDPGDGAAYDPATSTWRRIATSPLPAIGETAPVWTGHDLFVTGLYRGSATDTPPAAVYDPTTDTWRLVSPAGASSTSQPPEVTIVFATWTGTQVLVLTGPYAAQQPLNGFTWSP